MRPLALLHSLIGISLTTVMAVGQPPPLPENFKPVTFLVPKRVYTPPPDILTPQNYQRYRDETLEYLKFRPWAENSPAIRLDLLKTAMAMGNDQDEEQFRLDLIVYHPDSPEGNFLLQNSANSDLHESLIRRILNDDSKNKIDDFNDILKPLRYFKDSNDPKYKINKNEHIKELEEGIELMNTFKEKSKMISFLTPSKNHLEESEIEKLFLSHQIKSNPNAKKLIIKKEELNKIVANKSITQADFFIYFSHMQRDKLLNRCLLKFIFENMLDDQTKGKRSVSIIASHVYLTEKKFIKAEAILDNLIANKRECPQSLFMLAITKLLLNKPIESKEILAKLQKTNLSTEQKIACENLFDIINNEKDYTSNSFSLLDKHLDKTAKELPKKVGLNIIYNEQKKLMSLKIFIDFENNWYQITAGLPDNQYKSLIYIKNCYYFIDGSSKKTFKVIMEKHNYEFDLGLRSLENHNSLFFSAGVTKKEHLNLVDILKRQFASNFFLSPAKRAIYLRNCQKNLVFFKHTRNNDKYTISRHDFSSLTFDVSKWELVIDKEYNFKEFNFDDTISITPIPFESIFEPRDCSNIQEISGFDLLEIITLSLTELAKDFNFKW